MAIVNNERQWAAGVCGYQCEYILDTEADVKNLPECCTGSTAFVVATGNLYMVNASGKWVLVGGGA